MLPDGYFDLSRENPPKGLGKTHSGQDLFEIHLRRSLLPLVEILEDKTVRLIHTTVSQFLLGEEVEENGKECPADFRLDLTSSHRLIAITCITYLRWNFDTNCVHNPESLDFLDNKDLLKYAVLEWPGLSKVRGHYGQKERERSAYIFLSDTRCLLHLADNTRRDG